MKLIFFKGSKSPFYQTPTYNFKDIKPYIRFIFTKEKSVYKVICHGNRWCICLKSMKSSLLCIYDHITVLNNNAFNYQILACEAELKLLVYVTISCVSHFLRRNLISLYLGAELFNAYRCFPPSKAFIQDNCFFSFASPHHFCVLVKCVAEIYNSLRISFLKRFFFNEVVLS